jgi:hypothetical protein
MNDLLQKLDVWLKPVNEAVFANVQPRQIVRYVGILMLVGGILSLCVGISLITAGGLAAFGGALGTPFIQEAPGVTQEEVQQAQQALRELNQISGLVMFWGVLSIVSGPLLVIAAVGLFQRMSWGRMAAVIALAVNAVVSLLGVVTGGGNVIFGIIWTLLYAYLAYLFYHHNTMKQEFGVQ